MPPETPNPSFFDPTPLLFGKSVRPIFPIPQNIGRTVCAFPSWEGQRKMTPPLIWNRYTVRPIFPIPPAKPGFPTHPPVFFFPTRLQSGDCPIPLRLSPTILGDGNLIGFRLGRPAPAFRGGGGPDTRGLMEERNVGRGAVVVREQAPALMAEGRVCDAPGCSGKVLFSARRDGSEFCAGCGVVYKPRSYPVRRGARLSWADLLGSDTDESLRSAGDYGSGPL